MKILKVIVFAAINLCSDSIAIEYKTVSSKEEHRRDSNTVQTYEFSERQLKSVQPEYVRIASLFENDDMRFCMQPRSNAIPPIRMVTKPCTDSEKQLFYVDSYGFLRWSLNQDLCLMRFPMPKRHAILVLDNCQKRKVQEKILYSSFDGAIVIGRKNSNLRAATFEGKTPKRNVVIKMKKRDYDSPGQSWKIEHVSTPSLTPTSKPTTLSPTVAPSTYVPTAEPKPMHTVEPSVMPTSTPSAEPSVTPTTIEFF